MSCKTRSPPSPHLTCIPNDSSPPIVGPKNFRENMSFRRSTPKHRDSEVWTPWVGKRSGDDKDREIWTPWVGKRSGGGSDFRGEDVEEDGEARDVDWVYPLPQSPYL